jgi:hypothetical protein
MGDTLKSGFQISRRNRRLLLVPATMTCCLMVWIQWRRGREPTARAAMVAPG